jgi:hypothetical protein
MLFTENNISNNLYNYCVKRRKLLNYLKMVTVNANLILDEQTKFV